MNEFANKLSKELAVQKEKLIKDAINYKIGNSEWCIADLTGRGEMKILPDKTEIFAFDGQELIHFGNFRTEIDNKAMGWSIKAVQEYRLLYS